MDIKGKTLKVLALRGSTTHCVSIKTGSYECGVTELTSSSIVGFLAYKTKKMHSYNNCHKASSYSLTDILIGVW